MKIFHFNMLCNTSRLEFICNFQICVCVCVREREREKERECVCVRERECVCERETVCVCVTYNDKKSMISSKTWQVKTL
jgi:hypothetical protein